MSTDAYEDILNRAKSELTPEECNNLAKELAALTIINGGKADGRTIYDALNARGLIGFMTEGPGDLSTNPKHMEGFGSDAD